MLIKVCSFEVNLEAFIHFLARSEKTNQKRGATPKAPYIGGCNLLRAETALRKGFGKFYEAFALKGKTWIFLHVPFGENMRVWDKLQE